MSNAVIFVSKRLQRPVAAILCIMAAQLLVSLSSCHPEPVPMATRVAISR